MVNTHLSTCQRAEIVILYEKNISISEIARRLKISRRTVQLWVRRYANLGHIHHVLPGPKRDGCRKLETLESLKGRNAEDAGAQNGEAPAQTTAEPQPGTSSDAVDAVTSQLPKEHINPTEEEDAPEVQVDPPDDSAPSSEDSWDDDSETSNTASEDEDMVELNSEPLDEERALEDESCQKADIDASSIAAEDEDMVELKTELHDGEHTAPADPLSVTQQNGCPVTMADESSESITKEETAIEQESPEPDLEKYKALYFEIVEEMTSLKMENQRLTNENQKLYETNKKLTIAIKKMLRNNKGKENGEVTNS